MGQLKFPLEWLRIQIGDVVSYGKTQKCELSDVTDDTWVLELEDIEKESSRVTSHKTAAERPFKSTKNQFERGNVLYGKLRPYLNKVVVADTGGVCTTEIIPLDSEPFVLNRYLFYWLKTRDFLNYVNEVSYGVNMPRLGTKDGVAAPFVLAPLAEQKVIADKLDTLLAQVENTKARLERIPQILKRFRQSVLAAAVSGRLTEEWRGSCEYKSLDLGLEKSEELVFSPADWQRMTLADACNIVSGNAFKSGDFTEAGSTPAIKISNVQYGAFEKKNQQYLPETYLSKYQRFEVLPGDLLMALTRPITNDTLKVCRYPISEPAGLLNQRVAKFLFHNEQEKMFFELLFQSSYFKLQVYDKLSETLQPNLSPVDLKKFLIALPPSSEQTEIVRRVDQLFAHADFIEQQVNNALACVNNLTQSILAKAFRGELTEQWRKDNPELISGENSAEALFERIKAERAEQKPAGRQSKKKKSELPAT